MKEFQDQWAVILGGSSGLGLATARKLASHGLHICLVHRDRKVNLEQLETELSFMRSQGVEVRSYNKDALKSETIDQIAASLPLRSVKLLVHSIAKGSVKPFFTSEGEGLSREDLRVTWEAMALSWYDWTKVLLANNKFAENARNIAFTSEGNTKAIKNYGAVSIAKVSLEAIMRQMAVELAPHGITTNCIQAGVTLTPSFGRIPESKKMAEFSKLRNPFNRLTVPEDIANVVYLLARDEAGWINGVILKADGGESLR